MRGHIGPAVLRCALRPVPTTTLGAPRGALGEVPRGVQNYGLADTLPGSGTAPLGASTSEVLPIHYQTLQRRVPASSRVNHTRAVGKSPVCAGWTARRRILRHALRAIRAASRAGPRSRRPGRRKIPAPTGPDPPRTRWRPPAPVGCGRPLLDDAGRPAKRYHWIPFLWKL